VQGNGVHKVFYFITSQVLGQRLSPNLKTENVTMGCPVSQIRGAMTDDVEEALLHSHCINHEIYMGPPSIKPAAPT
jgi:hypothetical protein